MKNELENLGFAAKHPMRARVIGTVKQARGNRKEIIDNVFMEICTRLDSVGLPALVKGREKHLYSIYRKMKNKELQFNEVMDIYAFRLIFDTIDDCYRALGVMHSVQAN